jgi:hypothetical protein
VIALPSELFSSAQAGNETITVTLPGNQPLPSWLSFDAEKKSLLIAGAPPNALPTPVVLTVGNKITVVQISESKVSL